MDLILRNARVVGNESVTTDIGIDKGRIAVIQPKLAAEGETLDLGGRLVTPGFIETHIHLDKSRILGRCKAEKRRPGGGDRRGRQAEEAVHGRGRLRQRQGHAGEGDPQRHDAHAHAAGGRSRHRPARARRRAAADRGVQVGDRPGDLHLPAGGPAQQSRHRRADGRRRSRAAARWSAPRPTPTAARTARSTASSRSPASSTSTSTCISISRRRRRSRPPLRLRAGRALQVGRARRHRPRHQAVDRSARSLRQVRQAHGRRRRRPHGAALDRPLPDGPAHDAQRHARRDRGAQAAAPRRQLHALDQQRAEPLHAVRRLLAGAHGQHLRQHLPGRLRPRHARVLQHDHDALGQAHEPRRLRPRRSASPPTWRSSTPRAPSRPSPSLPLCSRPSSAGGAP